MNKISYYYLELVKLIITAIILFALFGVINDAIIEGITGSSFPNPDFLQYKGSHALYILQHIACALLVFVLYKNTIQFIGFNKNKKGKKLSPKWSKTIIYSSFLIIIIYYLFLLLQ
ncbi:hypothetical protein [Niallia sp. NCCP-28]|uniref:hypothetical protein n=1 Tax=Niallia sp. NCCP-28 TaxID=2934712 RepID=UPI002084DC4C|nr:hypothetical protein [Niallia sp. NCCP-28]GKU80758.1 hypothetical protein NCCP28_01540 [Niallia sp. NCCP-28]